MALALSQNPIRLGLRCEACNRLLGFQESSHLLVKKDGDDEAQAREKIRIGGYLGPA